MSTRSWTAVFAALVAASEVAFLVLRIVGAVVLIYLGVRAWRAAWQQPTSVKASEAADGAAQAGTRWWWLSAFGEGAVVQLRVLAERAADSPSRLCAGVWTPAAASP